MNGSLAAIPLVSALREDTREWRVDRQLCT